MANPLKIASVWALRISVIVLLLAVLLVPVVNFFLHGPSRLGLGPTLLWAAKENHVILAKTLLKLGVDPNFTPKGLSFAMYGATALGLASYYGNTVMLDLLVKHGAEINLKDKNHSSPIFFAISNGQVAAVETLLTLGGNINLPDEHGATPLMYAIQRNQYSCIDALIRRGANLNAKDQTGVTPFQELKRREIIANFEDALSEAKSKFGERVSVTNLDTTLQ